MASHRANYYEQEVEEDIGEVGIDIAIGNYGQNFYDTENAGISEVQLAQLQHQIAQQTALANVPDPVKRFIIHFHQAIVNNNLQEISAAYASGWNRLTDSYFAKTEWPEAEIISPLVGEDPTFLVLYRELYYRHVYSRLSPNIDDRFHSYENSCELFNYLLNSEGPVSLSLPDIWLWDIVDEFIYQFQSFCVWRSKVKTKSDEELGMLNEGSQIWSSYSVLNVLYSLIQKSKINEFLEATNRGASQEEIQEVIGDFGARPLYKMLGYFSIIGLLRVHVLLGDYTLALKCMSNIELNQKALFTRVTACHVATYYYVGFSYLMLKRYSDATRTFASILNFISRMKQYHTRSYQYEQINKTGDRMYALLAMTYALSPSRLDDNILTAIRERHGEQFNRLSLGESGIRAFEELYLYACPKFITANGPPYQDTDLLGLYVQDPPPDPAQRHVSLFLADVKAVSGVATLRSFLKLYKSLDTKKLADLWDSNVNAEVADAPEMTEADKEEAVIQQMMVFKQHSRSVSKGPEGTAVPNAPGAGALLSGSIVSTSDMDFVIDENMVHIVESTVGRRYGGWFIKNTEHTLRVFDSIRSTPLPIPRSTGVVPTPAGVLPAEQATKPKVAWGGVSVQG